MVELVDAAQLKIDDSFFKKDERKSLGGDFYFLFSLAVFVI